MKYTCPNCFKEIEVKMTDEDKKKVMQVLLEDKDFMFEMGKRAAEAYIKKVDEK